MKQIDKFVSDTKDKIKKIDYSKLYDAGLGFWILLILIFVFVILFFVYIKEVISVFVTQYGYLAIFIVSFVTDLLVQPLGPDVPLVLGVVAGLDPWFVFFVVLAGAYLALIAAYYLGKTLGAAGIERLMGKKNFAKLSKYETGSKWFMFIGALTPVPYIPYLAGLWRFSFIDTIIFVVVPRTLRFLFVLFVAYYLGVN